MKIIQTKEEIAYYTKMYGFPDTAFSMGEYNAGWECPHNGIVLTRI